MECCLTTNISCPNTVVLSGFPEETTYNTLLLLMARFNGLTSCRLEFSQCLSQFETFDQADAVHKALNGSLCLFPLPKIEIQELPDVIKAVVSPFLENEQEETAFNYPQPQRKIPLKKAVPRPPPPLSYGLPCEVPCGLPCEVPCGLPCEVPCDFPCEVPCDLQCEFPYGLPCEVPYKIRCRVPKPWVSSNCPSKYQ